MTTQTAARSNTVIRSYSVGTTRYDVLACNEGHEFDRPNHIRGVKPFVCSEHLTATRSPRVANPVTLPEPVANVPAPSPMPANPRHYRYSLIQAIVGAGVHIFLVGPAGSGKTTVSRQLAGDMGLEFFTESGHELMTAYDLLGFKNAIGEFILTYLCQAMEFGGVFLMDEMDAMNSAAMVAMNNIAALAPGDPVRIGERLIEIHADFHLVGGGNTWGRGANGAYSARVVLDAATLDRFAAIEFGYDERLEFVACGVPVPASVKANPRYKRGSVLSGDACNERTTAWILTVQRYRAALATSGIDDALVTPRASIMGSKMLRAGIHEDYVMAATVRKGLSSDEWRTLEANLAVA